METVALSKPTPEQEAYLAQIEADTGANDWAVDAAARHLRYLRKCENEAEELDYLAAAFRMIEAKGALRASGEMKAALLVIK